MIQAVIGPAAISALDLEKEPGSQNSDSNYKVAVDRLCPVHARLNDCL